MREGLNGVGNRTVSGYDVVPLGCGQDAQQIGKWSRTV